MKTRITAILNDEESTASAPIKKLLTTGPKKRKKTELDTEYFINLLKISQLTISLYAKDTGDRLPTRDQLFAWLETKAVL